MNAYINSGSKGGTMVRAVIGDSTHLPPVWYRFKSRRRLRMLVGLVAGSLPCMEKFFFSGSSVFFPQQSSFHGS